MAQEKIKPTVGGDALLFGIEAAAIMGPLHGHAEFIKEDGDLGSVEGGFIYAGYFLTEKRANTKQAPVHLAEPNQPTHSPKAALAVGKLPHVLIPSTPAKLAMKRSMLGQLV